jgi:hypothetical protein
MPIPWLSLLWLKSVYSVIVSMVTEVCLFRDCLYGDWSLSIPWLSLCWLKSVYSVIVSMVTEVCLLRDCLYGDWSLSIPWLSLWWLKSAYSVIVSMVTEVCLFVVVILYWHHDKSNILGLSSRVCQFKHFNMLTTLYLCVSLSVGDAHTVCPALDHFELINFVLNYICQILSKNWVVIVFDFEHFCQILAEMQDFEVRWVIFRFYPSWYI